MALSERASERNTKEAGNPLKQWRYRKEIKRRPCTAGQHALQPPHGLHPSGLEPSPPPLTNPPPALHTHTTNRNTKREEKKHSGHKAQPAQPPPARASQTDSQKEQASSHKTRTCTRFTNAWNSALILLRRSRSRCSSSISSGSYMLRRPPSSVCTTSITCVVKNSTSTYYKDTSLVAILYRYITV